MRILVVDDEEIKRVSLVDDLTAAGHDAVAVGTGEEALRQLPGDPGFDVVLTDLRMPGIDGMELLRRVMTSADPRPDVILMTAYGNIPLAVEAMKIGAIDFITKPFRNDAILPLLRRIETRRNAPEAAGARGGSGPAGSEGTIVGGSPAMRDVREMVEICGRTDATVLLTGETGTGKDLVAATIHERSPRRKGPFVKVNCALFPQALVEGELYGHEKGAFTGADSRRMGKLDLAQGGSLFLDDVDDIPLAQQIKLLRVIEEKVFEPLGSARLVVADVRVIAATKVDLLSRVQAGAFRSDLYYRLNVLRIDLPPLREHLSDLPALTNHLLERLTSQEPCPLDDDALRLLGEHRWPGNVRELANALERAILIGGGVISRERLADLTPQQAPDAGAGSFKGAIRHAERTLLEAALLKAGGNKSVAARSLGMKLSTFRDKLARHEIP